MLQFLGPEMESSISQMFRPRNCGNAAIYFWAQKLSKCCNFWAQKLQESCNFWAHKLQLRCNLISGPRNCRNAAISGARNCANARKILYLYAALLSPSNKERMFAMFARVIRISQKSCCNQNVPFDVNKNVEVINLLTYLN